MRGRVHSYVKQLESLAEAPARHSRVSSTTTKKVVAGRNSAFPPPPWRTKREKDLSFPP